MSKNYLRNSKENLPTKYLDLYHCHFALKDLINRLVIIRYLNIIDYDYHPSRMTVKMDASFYFWLDLPIKAIPLAKFSIAILKFTNLKEKTLCKVLFENTSLSKLRDDHCMRCPERGSCKAFSMSKNM